MINKKVAEDESLKNVQVPPKSPTSMITRVQKVYVPTHEEDDDEEELRFGVELNRYPPRSPVPKPRTPPPFKNTSESDTDGGKSTPDITSGHRKSVSFDFSGDERSRSDFSDTESTKRPIKSILRTPSPSSSTNSTLERPKPDRLPIVPTIAKITEVDSPVQSLESQDSQDPLNYYQQSTDDSEIEKVEIDELEYPPTRLEKFGELNERGEIQRENPFREAVLYKKPPDAYEEMAKFYSKNLPKLKREGSRSNEDLLSETTQHVPTRQYYKSTENLAVIRKPQTPPPPPPKPEKNIKHANVVRNTALESFQNSDVGVGDFTVFEHNAETNVIHKVADMPLPPTPKSPKRPTDSPPPPPINYDTMPSLHDLPLPPPPIEILMATPTLSLSTTPTKRQKQFVHENSPDNILVPEEVHRTILLQENEIRNAIRKHSTTSSESSVKTVISNSAISEEIQSSNSNNNTFKQSVNPFLDSDDVFLDSNTKSDTNSLISSGDDLQQTRILSPTQIFPTPQILPVQYTNLPMPQNASQPQFIHITGTGATSSASVVAASTTTLLPASLPPIFCSPGFTFAPNSIFEQQQQLIQEQQRQLKMQQEQLKGLMVSELSSATTLPPPPPLPPKPLKFSKTLDDNDNFYENSVTSSVTVSRVSKDTSFYEEPIVFHKDDDCIYATIEESLTYIEDSSVDSCADMPPVPPTTASLKRLSSIRESKKSEAVGKETCV